VERSPPKKVPKYGGMPVKINTPTRSALIQWTMHCTTSNLISRTTGAVAVRVVTIVRDLD